MVYGLVNPVYTVEGNVVLIRFTEHDRRAALFPHSQQL